MPLDIEYIDPAADLRWHQVCVSSPDGWYWHTAAWWSYTLAYNASYGQRSAAFIVKDGGEPVAIVPLLLEEHGPKDLRFSFGLADCWCPAMVPGLSEDDRRQIFATIFEEIQKRAVSDRVSSASFRWTPLAPNDPHGAISGQVAAMRHGWVDASLITQVLDLDVPLGRLMRAMTKGHRSDVARGLRQVDVLIEDASNAEAASFEAYRQLHREAAGRETRPRQTFDLMSDWIGAGNAILGRAVFEGEVISAAYVLVWRHCAYYASSASSAEGRRLAAGHALQWGIIEWLRAHEIARYELGLQPFGTLPHEETSPKDLAIARFKRGFGGQSHPAWSRRRFWRSEAWAKEQERYAARYPNREFDEPHGGLPGTASA